MSTERKPDPDAGGRYLMKLLAEDEAERIESLSDEEFLAELKATGRDAWPTPSAEELIAKVKARAALQANAGPQAAPANGERHASDAVAPIRHVAPVVRLAPRSRTRLVVSLLAAALVVAIFVVLTKGPAIVAHFREDHPDEPIEPHPPQPPEPNKPAP